MSRRHRGRARNGPGRLDDAARTQAMLGRRDEEPARPPIPERRPEHATDARPEMEAATTQPTVSIADVPIPGVQALGQPLPVAGQQAPDMPEAPPTSPATPATATTPAGETSRAGCTAPQLRRFIKARPYVPMHELRRRFGINGTEDDVHPLDLEGGPVFVGLPERECALLGELVRGGEVGYELSLDPRTPIVVGVYPMRPVPRA